MPERASNYYDIQPLLNIPLGLQPSWLLLRIHKPQYAQKIVIVYIHFLMIAHVIDHNSMPYFPKRYLHIYSYNNYIHIIT